MPCFVSFCFHSIVSKFHVPHQSFDARRKRVIPSSNGLNSEILMWTAFHNPSVLTVCKYSLFTTNLQKQHSDLLVIQRIPNFSKLVKTSNRVRYDEVVDEKSNPFSRLSQNLPQPLISGDCGSDIYLSSDTLPKTNISHLGKRKIRALGGDKLVSRTINSIERAKYHITKFCIWNFVSKWATKKPSYFPLYWFFIIIPI